MKLLNFKIIVYVIILLSTSRLWALDPNVDYAEMSSEHFTIIFNATQYGLAKVYLNEAERSYRILTKVFSEAPTRTLIVMDSTTDIANGSATGLPRPAISAFTSLPTPLDTIDHYSYWPRDLLTHEYTHILNMEPTHGVFKPLRFIFGSIVKPNMLLPKWYLEGLAVEMESRWDSTGRLKTTDYDGMIRAFYLEGKWGKEDLSQIGETSSPSWPQGQRPYFYGALLWHDLIEKKGVKIVDELNQRYSRRFPFFLTTPIEDEIQKSYQDFLKDMYRHYANLAEKQIQKIKEHKTTPSTLIKIPGAVFAHSPEISPDGQKLAMVSGQTGSNSLIVVYDRNDGTFKANKKHEKSFRDISEADKNLPNRASWFPNSKKLVFDGADVFDHYYLTYDLYVWDLEKNKMSQLTLGQRAREPSVSPDGNTIVCIQSDGSDTRISLMDSNGKNIRTVYIPPQFIRVAHPSFVNNNEIIFSQKDSAGLEHLHILNLQSKTITRTYTNLKDSRQPNVTKEGVVFTSIDSGVENLYITTPDFKKTKILSNSLSRILNGTLDFPHKKIIFSEMTADGAQIKQAPYETVDVLPKVEPLIAGDFPKEVVNEAPDVHAEKQNYHAYNYLFPQFWLPDVEFVPGGVIPSITIPAQDALGFHQYALAGSYDSRDRKYDGVLTYAWDNPLALSILTTGETHAYYQGINDSTSNRFVNLLNATYFLPNSERWYALLGYEYNENTVLESSSVSNTRDYFWHAPTIGIGYGHIKQKLTDISPHGNTAEVTYSYIFNKTFKKNYDKIYFELAHYQTAWLPDRHVLALSAQGVFTPNNHRNVFLNSTTTQSDVQFGPQQDAFIMRGYPWGEFLGYSMLLGSMEYRFPIKEIYDGPDSPNPIFYKKIYGDIFTDAVTVNGIFFDTGGNGDRAKFGKYYFSSGAELKVDTTMFYQLPLTFKIVFAYGYDKMAQGGSSVYASITSPNLLGF